MAVDGENLFKTKASLPHFLAQHPAIDTHLMQDGFTYERVAIEAWFKHHKTSPLTNEALASKELQPNMFARQVRNVLFGTN